MSPRNTFCKTVWNGIHILPDGYIRLCSIGQNTDRNLDMQRCRDDSGEVMHILKHDISEIINSDKHREVRLLNVNQPEAWSPHCDCCEQREKSVGFPGHKSTSRRVHLMKMINTDGIVNDGNYLDKVETNGTVNWYPQSLDIRFGNLCNQRCIMCGPHFSNLWYDEFADYYNTTEFGQGTQIQIVKDPIKNKWIEPPELEWFNDPAWWNKFEQMIPHLRHIYITGGEPMVTPAHDTMLDMLISSGYAKNIFLEYDSNCSVINPKITNRWKTFKRVELRGSVDAIEDRYELIRYGGKWNKFIENIKTLKEFERTNKNFALASVTSCVQLTTIHTILETEEFFKKLKVPYHIRFLEGPPEHSIAMLPKWAKEELLTYFEKYPGSNSAQMIVNYLKLQIENGKEELHRQVEFVKFMDYLDKSRGTNWRTVFPEVNHLINRCLDNTQK